MLKLSFRFLTHLLSSLSHRENGRMLRSLAVYYRGPQHPLASNRQNRLMKHQPIERRWFSMLFLDDASDVPRVGSTNGAASTALSRLQITKSRRKWHLLMQEPRDSRFSRS